MKEIRFHLDEVFSTDDILSVWILTLSRIHSDIVIVNNNMLRLFEMDCYSESEMIYFSRLAASHYREAIKFIDLFNQKGDIRDFVNALEEDLRDKYSKLLSSVISEDSTMQNSKHSFNDSYVGKHIKPIRDNFFHYYNKDKTLYKIKDIFDKLENHTTKIIVSGNSFNEIDMVFADELSVFISYESLESDDLTSFTKELVEYVTILLDFIQASVGVYFSNNLDKLTIVEL